MKSNKNLKVLFVASYYPPEHTGAGLRSHRTFKRIKERYPVDILVLSKNRKNKTDYFEEYEGQPILRVWTGNSLLKCIYNIRRVYYKYNLNSYDIVYCGGDVYIHIAAALLARVYSQNIVMEVVKNKSEERNNIIEKIKYIVNFIRFGYIRVKLQQRSNLLIALNKHIKRYYKKIGVSEDRIWTRPNPVDTRIFNFPTPEQREYVRRIYGIYKNQYVHLMVGGIKARKNQKFVVDYFKKLPSHHVLIIAGPVENSYYLDDLIKSINENMLLERVKLLEGFHNNVINLYHTSDVLILPSFAEGTPNVMLEALCCGLPVLLNEKLGIDEFIDNGKNGWTLPLDSDKFVFYSRLCEEKLDKQSVRSKIAKSACENFNYKILDELLYNKLIMIHNNSIQ